MYQIFKVTSQFVTVNSLSKFNYIIQEKPYYITEPKQNEL